MRAFRTSPTITAKAAHKAVAAAVARAKDLGVAVNACVVDAGGNQIAFLKGDGAFLPSGGIARDKAYTAAGFGTATGFLYENLSGDAPVLTGILAQPGIAAFKGGLPIRVGNEVIGGIGISGASAEDDEQCARAGLAAIGLEQD